MPLTSRILFDDNEDRKSQEEDAGLFQFGAGLSAGIKQTQALLGGGLPALVQSAIGDEDDAYEYLQYYNKKMQEASEVGGDFQRIEDIDGAEDAVQWLTYTLGKALPDIGTSIIGGGAIGAAVKYGAKKYIAENVEREVKKKAGDAFEKAMVKQELARRTAKARRVGAALGGYGTSIALNAGETFANVYEESGGIEDPALALGTGIAAGALDALAPMSILKKILPDNMAGPFKEAMVDRLLRNKGMVKRAFIEGVRTGGIEGATEAAQELLQAAAVGMFNDPQGGYKSYGESFLQALNDPTEQQRSQYLNAFAAGFVGGGGMGGISGAMYKPRTATERDETSEAPPASSAETEGQEAQTPETDQPQGFESYSDYLDAYESGPARLNRRMSLEAIQNVIPDEFYMGQDMTPEQEAEYEAETERLRREFNPNLEDLVGQVVGQGNSEGVLRRRSDGVFVYTDFQTGDEVAIESGEANQDQPAEVSGIERRDSTAEFDERDSGVSFNAEDSTFSSPDRRNQKFRYVRTNYSPDGSVSSVTAEVAEGARAGESRTFQQRMANQIEEARLKAEGNVALESARENLSQAPSQQEIGGTLSGRAAEASPLPQDVSSAVEAQLPEQITPLESQLPMTPEAIATQMATAIADAMGNMITSIQGPQAQSQQQAVNSIQADQGPAMGDIENRTAIETGEPQTRDGLGQRLSETEEMRQQQLRSLDDQTETDRLAGEMPTETAPEKAASKRDSADSDESPLLRRDDSALRGATRRPVVTDEELNAVIDRVVGGNQETRDLINVVDRFDQLPEDLQRAAREQGSDGSDVDAVSHRGQIYIVKGRMRSASRLERALLHEGTHGGISQMFADAGVSKSLNRMYVAMGGKSGFERIANELGIRDQLAPYEEGTREAGYDTETRNFIMVSEMLAYTGEEGGNTLKSRIREVIGAIRDWLRSNGFARLATMRASDIAFIAKNAREDYFNNNQARQDGQPMLSRVRDRAQKDFMGLYSNAEQILLDEGDKIFKTSKKNPEGSAKADQILAFLKARGLKKEEARYTKIERFLEDPFSLDVRDEARPFYLQRLMESVGDAVEDGMTPEQALAARYQRLDQLLRSSLKRAYENNSSKNKPEGESFAEQTARADRQAEARRLLKAMPTQIPSASGNVEQAALNHMASIENVLRSVPVSQIAEMSGKPADRFTRDEIIEYLREYAPDLNETVESGLADGGTSEGVTISDGTVLNDSSYYENIWDDINYSAERNEWDDYGASELLDLVIEIDTDAFSDWAETIFGGDSLGLEPDKISQIDPRDRRDVVKVFEENGADLYLALNDSGLLAKSLTDMAWDVAEEIYMQDPEYSYEVYRGDELVGYVQGNEERGFYGTDVFGGRTVVEDEYDLDEVRVQFASFLRENGYSDGDSGETRFFDYLKIDESDVKGYREKVVTLENNRLADSGRKFQGGHFDEDNILFHVLITERETEFGNALVIEELQSDWHSDIRRSGGPFDADQLMIAQDELEQYEYLRKETGEQAGSFILDRLKLDRLNQRVNKLRSAPPDSPFRNDQYLDLAAKGIIRDAVSENKGVVAFSKGSRVQSRWSESYDYEAIYDKKLKKVFDRLMGPPVGQMTGINTRSLDGAYNENGFWVYEISDELRQQVEIDGMPMFRRITNQTNAHDEASNKGQLLNGELSSNEFTLDDETRGELWLRRIQDKYLPLKKFEAASAKFLGLKELPDHMQAYVGETLHSGKQAKDMDDLEREYILPLSKIIRDNDIDIDDFGLYLIAKHAEERNNYIASINERLPDGGSGMLTEDARRVIDEMENPSFLKASKIVYDMLAANRKRMKDFGLVDEDTIDAWQDRYSFYVPLKGFASLREDGDVVAPRRTLPKGFNISGREALKSLGRQSESENPVLFAIADSEEKIVRARRSEPSRQFLSLADALVEAESDQLGVYRPDDEYPMMDEQDARGAVVQRRMRASDMRKATRRNGDKRFLTVKEDGNEVFIEIKNDALNRTMHNVGSENYSGLVSFLGSTVGFMRNFQNFRRNMLINWNPSWFLINPLRDLQTGLMYNLAQESKEGGMVEGENLTGEIMRRYFPAYSAYYKNLRGNKADNEYDAYYKEYTEAGAPTGLTLTKDIEEQRARLFALVTDGPLKAKGKQGLREIEYLNTASENAVRFSAYVSAREAGVSVQKAANLAKNLTVNFNRKGEVSDGLNLFYLFFNAAVQGTANIAQAMSGRTADGKLTKAQVGAASIALLAFMVTQHNLNAADEDEDGESLYNDLSDYDHLMSWNMVLNDGKTFAQIPMPYGYGFFHTLGRLGAEFVSENKDAGDVAAEITASFAHHMLPPPLGFLGSVGKVDDLDDFGALALGNVAPSVFEPVVQYATNTNHFGSPLYLEDNPLIRPSAPDATRSKRSTSQVYKDIAQWMNEATGGSLYRSGAIDVSPDGMQYMQEYLLGGLGRFVNRSSDLAAKLNSPQNEEITASNIPIVRYFFGEPSEYADKMDYYDYISSATQVFKEAEELTGAERVNFLREFAPVVRLQPLYKETQKQLRKLRQQKKQVEKTQKDPVRAYDQIERIERDMQLLFDRFNKRYREATK